MHDAAVAARLPFRDIVMTRHNLGEEPAVVSVSGEPIFDDEGRFRGYRGVARDITLRKRAEREIEDARRFLDALIDTFPTPILVKDAQHRYVAANGAFARFFRRGLADILGKNDFDFFSPEDATYFQETDRRVPGGRRAGGVRAPLSDRRPHHLDAGAQDRSHPPRRQPGRRAPAARRHRAQGRGGAAARERAALPQPDPAVGRLVLGAGRATALHLRLRRAANGNDHASRSRNCSASRASSSTWSGSRRPHARSTWPRCWRAVRSGTCWCATAPAASG